MVWAINFCIFSFIICIYAVEFWKNYYFWILCERLRYEPKFHFVRNSDTQIWNIHKWHNSLAQSVSCSTQPISTILLCKLHLFTEKNFTAGCWCSKWFCFYISVALHEPKNREKMEKKPNYELHQSVQQT